MKIIGFSFYTFLTLSLILSPWAVSEAAANETPPNIVLVLIDDMGWMDLACQGNSKVSTPVIDQIAKDGMRFTDAYSAAPVCSPTRASIMTGLSPARLHITNHIPDQKRFIPKNAKLLPAAMKNVLDLEYETLAERLKELGYKTGFFGKWHLSGKYKRGDQGRGDLRYAPEKHGFDVNVGGSCYGGPPTFFDPYGIYSLPSRKKGEYLPDRLVDEIGTFMEKNKKDPIFISLWYYTVHWPMEAPESYLKKYRGKEGPGLKDHRYGAMIEALDDSMGVLLKKIESLGLTDNTIIVFTSDNGGFSGVADMRPLRESKGYLYEGGIRVPMIVKWPGKIRKGSICKKPVVSTDLYPTLIDIAGGSRDSDRQLDGVSIKPLLLEKGSFDRSALYFHYPNYAFHQGNRLGSAIREGDWKLIEYFDTGELELYNLAKDIGEKKNLASQNAKLAARLKEKLHIWRKEVKAAMPTLNPNHVK